MRFISIIVDQFSDTDTTADFGYKGLSLMRDDFFLVRLFKMYVISVSYKVHSDDPVPSGPLYPKSTVLRNDLKGFWIFQQI